MTIKPCPFCGSAEKVTIMKNSFLKSYFGACKNCGTFGPSSSTKKGAEMLWNKRSYYEEK